jgi:hypothetical protein
MKPVVFRFFWWIQPSALLAFFCLPSPWLEAATPEADGERPLELRLGGTPQVAQYEKIEFQISPRQVFARPYDPAEADLVIEIATPAKRTVVVPAFFIQDYEWRSQPQGGRQTAWWYPTNDPGWRARFAPDEPGRYSAKAVWRGRLGAQTSPVLSFTCQPKAGKGCVRVSRKDPRFFEFDNGTPFFPIGQNVAFIGSGQYLDSERAVEVFRKMAENGANFARVWVCAEDWALALEARKSAWGRSWSWNPPLAPLPGGEGYHADELCVRIGGTNAQRIAVSPTQPIALRPGVRYQFSGRLLAEPDASLVIELQRASAGEPIRGEKKGQWTSFKREFTTTSNQWWLGDLALRAEGQGRVWLRHLSLREAGGGPELLGEADPNRQVRGNYNQLDCALLDRLVEAAERHGIYLQLTLLTRDHYRHALAAPHSQEYSRAIADAQNLLRYIVARWGYSSHVMAWEYFNEMDPNAPTERFHRELGLYLEQGDPYRHLRTTSGWGPAPKHWTHPQLDIADLHWYLRPAWGPLWRDEVAAVLDRVKLVRGHAANKPAVLGEFGLATDTWGSSPYLVQDKELVNIHNTLWASALSGLSGAAFFWWWDTLDKMNVYPHYRPLAAFVADIPFTTAQFQSVVLATEKRQCRVVALRGKTRVDGWLFNPQAAWGNLVLDQASVEEVKGDSFSLPGLEPGAYRLQWWDTHAGKVLQEQSITVTGQTVALTVPAFARDLAFKIFLDRRK